MTKTPRIVFDVQGKTQLYGTLRQTDTVADAADKIATARAFLSRSFRGKVYADEVVASVRLDPPNSGVMAYLAERDA